MVKERRNRMNTDNEETKLLMPTYFTSIEGGTWIKYEGDGFTKKQLAGAALGKGARQENALFNRLNVNAPIDPPHCLKASFGGINYIVYAFAFGAIHLGPERYPKWDIFDGWTTPIAEGKPAAKKLTDFELGALTFTGKLDDEGYLAVRRVYNNEMYANISKQNAINLAAHILVTHGIGSYCLNSLCIKMRRLEELTSGAY